MIDTSFREFLAGFSVLTHVVGSRIYKLKAPRGTLQPHILYHVESQEEFPTLDGNTALKLAEIKVTCRAAVDVDAANLGEIVSAIVDGHSGAMGSDDIILARQSSKTEGYEEPEDGSDDGGFFVVEILFRIQFIEE